MTPAATYMGRGRGRPAPLGVLRRAVVAAALVLSVAWPASAAESRAAGNVRLTMQKAQYTAPVVARLGTALDAPVYAGIIDFMGSSAVSFAAWVHNPTQRRIYYAYYFALFDQDGRLVAAGGAWKNRPIEPGERDSGPSMPVTVPPARAQSVASFQAVFYEADVEVDEDEGAAAPATRATRPASAPAATTGPARVERPAIDLAVFEGKHESAPVVATVGKDVRFEARFHRYFGPEGRRIWASGTIKNTVTARRYFAYSAAFFDADGQFVGGVGYNTHLAAREASYSQETLAVPKRRRDAIKSYELAVYEDVKDFPLR